jgi:predicted transcriptional regulator
VLLASPDQRVDAGLGNGYCAFAIGLARLIFAARMYAERSDMPGIQGSKLELDSTLTDRLQRLADARHRPAERLVQDAIREYLDREEEREQLRSDALAALEEYQRTGLHLTGEEVNAWLDKLAAGEEAVLPAPHK